MSTFSFKVHIEEQTVKEGNGVVTFPEHDEIISFDLFDAKVMQDNGDKVLVYLTGISQAIIIPPEARELFIKAWDKYRGCNVSEMWPEEAGIAVYTKPTQSPWGISTVDEVKTYDPHAAEFLNELKEFERRISTIEKGGIKALRDALKDEPYGDQES